MVNVCVPVLNRYDLLRDLLLSLEKSSIRPHRVYIINNGGDSEALIFAMNGVDLEIKVQTPAQPLGLAYCWNWFLGYTHGEDRIITNDDITFAPDSIQKMLDCPSDLVFPVGIGFSCFLIRDSCVEKVGTFDESLSPRFAYFEDCDYMNRIEEYAKRNIESPVSISDLPDTGITHYKNGTQELIKGIENILSFRRKYYIAQENYLAKWGKLPPGLRRMEEHESRKLKIIIVGDSPTVSTGFAHCTREVCRELYSSGRWEIHILALSYFGDPHNLSYTLYPCQNPLEYSFDNMGKDRLPALIESIKPDIVVLIQDPWNIPGYFSQLDKYSKSKESQGYGSLALPPIVGWLAVDAKNQKGYECNRLSHVITWTQFAIDELVAGGYTGESSIVPLGVDTDIFNRKNRAESRKMVCPDELPEDAYIVGVVGRNQPRKRLDLTIAYFAEWIRRYNISNAYLYIHTAPTGERACDIHALCDYHLKRHGIENRVILHEPSIGVGADVELMPYFYSAFDVLFSTSQAEGWYLPGIEAMACECSVICSDWAALGSQGGWTRDAVLRVPCTSTSLTAPLNAHPYTIGGVMDRESAVSALHKLYTFADMRKHLSDKGLLLAKELTWQRTGEQFREVIEGIVTASKSKPQVERTEADIREAAANA